MTFDEIDAFVRVLKKHDEQAIVDFTPEGGTFSVIFLNPRFGDDEVADILGELLKMSFINLSRTGVTDNGVRMLIRSNALRQVSLPQGISVGVIHALLQMPTVRGVHVAIPSPPPGYEAVAEWPDCVHSSEFSIRQTPREMREGGQRRDGMA
jgi:hypothetical protein